MAGGAAPGGCSLSTIFVEGLAAARGGEWAPDELFDLLDRAGARPILHAGLEPARLEALRDGLAERGVAAIEAPCPISRASAAVLCAPDRDESDVARRAIEETLPLAAELGAPFVIVRLGEARDLAAEWTLARDRFLRGELDERLVTRLRQARARGAGRSLDAARRAIDLLLGAAERAGVTLLLRNGRRFTDLPDPRELDLLLSETAGAPIAPALDVPAAHLPDVMGLQPLALTLAAFGPRAPLVFVGDACGPVGGLQPGRGQIDLAAVAAALPEGAARAFSPWPGLTPDEVVEAALAMGR